MQQASGKWVQFGDNISYQILKMSFLQSLHWYCCLTKGQVNEIYWGTRKGEGTLVTLSGRARAVHQPIKEGLDHCPGEEPIMMCQSLPRKLCKLKGLLPRAVNTLGKCCFIHSFVIKVLKTWFFYHVTAMTQSLIHDWITLHGWQSTLKIFATCLLKLTQIWNFPPALSYF